MIENIMEMGLNVLLYKHGQVKAENINQIDVWWKGEENDNFMALLSYIISQSDLLRGQKSHIRLIRRLDAESETEVAQREMEDLLSRSRLSGEVIILPNQGESIHDTIRKVSGGSSLILIGMPGKKAGGIAKIFSLDQLFFTKELEKFDDFPPILFVKAARIIDLFE